MTADSRGNEGESCPALARAGQLLHAGDPGAALAMLRPLRETGAPADLPYVDHYIGQALLDLDRRGEAYATIQGALADPAATVDDALTASLLNVLGRIYHADGKFQHAAEIFGRALIVAERLQPPDHDLRARLLINLGVVAFKSGQVEAATIYYERAIDAARSSGDARRLGMAHMGLGMARQEAGDYTAALSHAMQAMTQFERAGEPGHVVQALTNVALAYAEQEQWSEAVPHLQRALEHARSNGDVTAEAHALELLARARSFAGDHAGAVQLAADARMAAARVDDDLEAHGAALTEAAALDALGRRDEAAERYRMAITYFRDVGASRRLMAASHAYAQALRRWGRTDEALEVLDAAYAATIKLKQG